MTTTIEVIDTAVKVGLGAFISGLSAYWVAKSRNTAEASKERDARRRELLEAAAEQIEIFSHELLKYWALITEWQRNQDQGTKMLESRRDELDRSKSELFHAFKELTSAEAKLMLLGLFDVQESLRYYGDLARVFRRAAFVGSTELSESLLDEYRENLLSARNLLFKDLSKAYGNEA